MEAILKKELEGRNDKLRKLITEARQILISVEMPLDNVTKSKFALGVYIENVNKILDKYMATSDSPSEELSSACFKTMSEAQDLLIEIEALLFSVRDQDKIALNSSSVSTKLPQLTLPKFQGDILEFNSFWDRFNSGVGSRDLNEVDKLTYLLGCLEGTAQETLKGLAVTGSNYQVAISILQKRFGDKTLVIDNHYKALTSITRCADTADECRRTLDTIQRHLRTLESLGENISSNHLRSLILDKFPGKVIYEVNLQTRDDKAITRILRELDNVVTSMELAKMQIASTETMPTTSTEVLHIQATTSTGNKNCDKNPRKRKSQGKNQKKETAKKRKLSCIFCSGQHYNDECTSMRDMASRKGKLTDRCFKCLGKGHRAKLCKRKIKCYHCKSAHNRALCPRKLSSPADSKLNKINTQLLGTITKSTSFLQTATAQVRHKQRILKCRILLDSGSQRSYITQGLAKKLDLTMEREDLLMIYTFGYNKPKQTSSPVATITLLTRRNVEKTISVNVVPHITNRLAVPNYHSPLIDVKADDGSLGEGIDILIGNDHYCSFMRNEIVKVSDKFYLINSDFGWIGSGYVDDSSGSRTGVLSVSTYHQAIAECNYYTEPDLPLDHYDIKYLWSLESIGIVDSVKATREEEAIQYFNRTTEYHNGRYFVKWPWVDYPPTLPTNYGLSYGRLIALMQRLDPSTVQEYDEILKEQLQLGIIEKVEASQDPSCQTVHPVHYLPHHIVKQTGKRARVVYDASAKGKNQLSLNETLYKGPCMLQDLTELLINFRLNRVAVVADVEKAFLQVGLQAEDRDVTRFLWIKDIGAPISNENIVHLRFCRVPFGIISSPFLLTAVIRYHISKTDSSLTDTIANKCYVDNLVTGGSSSSEVLKLYANSKKIFSELSMNIRDWASNDMTVMNGIQEQDRIKGEEIMKVLGLIWDRKEDTLAIKENKEISTQNEPQRICKRRVLQVIASTYDPCGIGSPYLLPAKLFLQKLWKQNYNWDSQLPEDLSEEWKIVSSHLTKIQHIKVPRYALQLEPTQNSEYELHCFTDASKLAYAAAVYVRVDNGKKVKTTLLMSKSRVVPREKGKKTKPDTKRTQTKDNSLTIPQLELLGFVIGNRLLKYLKKIVAQPIKAQYLWSDSYIVLSWVRSKKLLTPWVSNRVNEIRQNAEVKLCYVNTKDNPADIATRPELDYTRLDSMWLNGPHFLSEVKLTWPETMSWESHTLPIGAEGLEMSSPDQQECQVVIPDEIPMETDAPIQTSEIQEIKNLQRKYFEKELAGDKTQLTRNLDLFKDVDGVLRCGGRLMHLDCSYETRHPILLPKNCEFTVRVIRETHEKNYHVGVAHTLSLVRQKYWILQGRTQVQKVLRHCPQCVKYTGGPYKLPITPALPPERVTYEAPHAYSGLDYFGPIFVKIGNKTEKRWICLLTCLVVRSIHLEIVKDMTAEECLMAIRRFIAVKVLPKLILSDNALYFKLTSEVMSNPFCIKNKIRWRFTPELAPWHGGVYERLVQVVKGCLKRSLSKHLLNDTQLSTIIKEVEAVVNTRPLTCVSSDPEYILKPADFLSLGKCLTLESSEDISQPSGSATKQDLILGWRRGLNFLKEFKEMFVNQYLLSLRERYSHSPKQPRTKSHNIPCVGDLVQIKGEGKNRQSWKVGRISSLLKGADGECRVAKVKVGNSEFTRSIGHLYPLEAEIQGGGDILIKTMTGGEPIPPLVTEEKRNGEMVTEMIENDVSDDHGKVPEEEIDPVTLDEGEVRGESMDQDTEDTIERLPEIEQDDSEVEVNDNIERGEESVKEGVRGKRSAAIKAREKIAEWTSQLLALL